MRFKLGFHNMHIGGCNFDAGVKMMTDIDKIHQEILEYIKKTWRYLLPNDGGYDKYLIEMRRLLNEKDIEGLVNLRNKVKMNYEENKALSDEDDKLCDILRHLGIEEGLVDVVELEMYNATRLRALKYKDLDALKKLTEKVDARYLELSLKAQTKKRVKSCEDLLHQQEQHLKNSLQGGMREQKSMKQNWIMHWLKRCGRVITHLVSR